MATPTNRGTTMTDRMVVPVPNGWKRNLKRHPGIERHGRSMSSVIREIVQEAYEQQGIDLWEEEAE